MVNLNELIGLKVVALRGFKDRKNTKYVEAEYIFFDDGETFIHLDEQDYYIYHDCSTSAKHLEIEKDAVIYRRMFDVTIEANTFDCIYW